MSEEKKDLKELEQKFVEAGSCGERMQKIGQRLVSASERGKEVIEIIKQDDSILTTPQVSSWLASANATVPSMPIQAMTQMDSYYYAVSTSSVSAIAITSVKTFRLKKEHELTEDELMELDELLKDFSTQFSGIGDLAAMRKGAWETFYSATEIILMSVSHAMREIMRKIISQIATNDEVKKAEWWEKPLDTDREVTTQQRLRYLIFGSTDDKSSEMVSMAVKTSFDAYDRLQKVAHGSVGCREEVKECMQITEYALLTMLRHRKLKSSQNNA